MRRSISFVLSALMGLALLTPPATADPVVAAPPTAAGFAPVTPTRVLDTRTTNTPVGPRGTVTLDLSTQVPATATAVVFNLTGTQPTDHTWITVYPSGVKRPNASNLNLMPGENRPNLVTVAVDSSRKVTLYNESGTVHLIADLSGYYAPEAPGKYTPVGPHDTSPVSLGPNSTTTMVLQEIPRSATAVTFFVSGEQATASTFITAWRDGTPRPVTSSLNLAIGQSATNQVTTAIGTDRTIALYNASGDVRVRLSVAGFYTSEFGATFTAMTPQRALDTRDTSSPLQPNERRTVDLSRTLPGNTIAAFLTVTGTQPSATTDIVVSSTLDTNWPSRTANLSLAPNQTAPLSLALGVGSRSILVHNAAGTVHLVVDLTGYFSFPPVAPCVTNCVYAWGENQHGRTGTGSAEMRVDEPRQVYGLSNVEAIATGIALRSDGSLWSWGKAGGNGWVRRGMLIPVRVAELDEVIAVDNGIALRKDGTVWVWDITPGSNGDTPRQVPQLTNITAVAAAGPTAFAVRNDGTVWAWGLNTAGSLGINAPHGAVITVPTQMPNIIGARSVAASGAGGLVVTNGGAVWSWGTNSSGQLGNGTIGRDCFGLPPSGPNCYSNVPVKVVNLANATAVASNGLSAFAVLSDGTARGWGENSFGGLGNGQDCVGCQTGTPTEVLGLNCARSVKTHPAGGYVLDCNGHVWTWGRNFLIGPPEYSTIAVRLAQPTGVAAIADGFALVP